jgi:hypothetical protein
VAIVRREGVTHSGKLNRCSTEAQIAYAHFITTVPDDFGRFVCNYFLIVTHMYPRRDDEKTVVKWSRAMRGIVAEWIREGLVRTFEIDGSTFGELTNWEPVGNTSHRTPEPPEAIGAPQGRKHEHNGRCLATAIRYARLYNQNEEAEILSNRLKELRDRGRDRDDYRELDGAAHRESDGKRDPSSTSSTSSTSSNTSIPTGTENNEVVGLAPDGPMGSPAAPADPEQRALNAAAKDVFAYWAGRTKQLKAQYTDERRRYIVVRLKEEPGSITEKVAGLKLAVDGALVDPYFNGSETGKSYLGFENIFRHKGRDRIEKLQEAARRAQSGGGRPASPGVDQAKRFLERRGAGGEESTS